MLEVTVGREPGGNFKVRKRAGDLFQAQAATLGDVERSRNDVRRILEDAIHRVAVLNIELRALELHPVRVLDGLAGLYADHDVLGVGIVFTKVVAIIGRDQGQTEILFQIEQASVDSVLEFEALVLNFEEKVFLAEKIAVKASGRAGCIVVPFHQTLCDFPLQAAGKADQSSRVLGQKLLADARLVVETVERSFRGDLHQVAVAFFVFGEHEQVVVRIAFRRRALDVVVVFLADVEFASDDGLDTCFMGRIDEVHGAKNIPVVGHRHRGHAEFFDAMDQFFDVAGAVEQGVVAMQVQVDEFGHENPVVSF